MERLTVHENGYRTGAHLRLRHVGTCANYLVRGEAFVCCAASQRELSCCCDERYPLCDRRHCYALHGECNVEP